MPDSKASAALSLSKFNKELDTLCEKYDVVTLDQLVRDVRAQDFLINNLFQISKGRWQCNLRRELPGKKEDFYEYGKGRTPEDALLNASHNANAVLDYSHMVARKKVRR
jgi:hypothetical protein